MKLDKRTKIAAGAIAATSALALAGGAFTATGITRTAPATQFVGGTVNQSVTGATLSMIKYGFTTPANTTVDEVQLTFTPSADGKTVTVNTGGGTGNWTCPAPAAGVTLCTATVPETGISNIDIVVNSDIAPLP